MRTSTSICWHCKRMLLTLPFSYANFTIVNSFFQYPYSIFLQVYLVICKKLKLHSIIQKSYKKSSTSKCFFATASPILQPTETHEKSNEHNSLNCFPLKSKPATIEFTLHTTRSIVTLASYIFQTINNQFKCQRRSLIFSRFSHDVIFIASYVVILYNLCF